MTNSIPELTNDDRKAALEKAIASRRARAALKEDIKTGKVSLAEVFEMETDAAKKMTVRHLLLCFKGIGETKADRIMEQIGIAASRRVGGLGERQKEALLKRFG